MPRVQMMTNMFLEVASVMLWSACGGYLGSLRRLLARWLLRYCLRSSGVVACWDAVFNFPSVLQR